MVESLYLEAKLKFAKWSALWSPVLHETTAMRPIMSSDGYGITVVVPVKTGIQRFKKKTGFLLAQE